VVLYALGLGASICYMRSPEASDHTACQSTAPDATMLLSLDGDRSPETLVMYVDGQVEVPACGQRKSPPSR
jgi:hypothetical protein